MKLRFSNLHPRITKQRLQAVLECFGKIHSIELINTSPSQFLDAYVEMPEAEAKAVLKYLDGDYIMDHPVKIRKASKTNLHKTKRFMEPVNRAIA